MKSYKEVIDRKCYTLWFNRENSNHPWIPEISPRINFDENITAIINKISFQKNTYRCIEVYENIAQKDPYYVVLDETHHASNKGVMLDLFAKKIEPVIILDKKIIGVAKQPIEGIYDDGLIYCPYSCHCMEFKQITGVAIEPVPGFLTFGRDSICHIRFDGIIFTISRYGQEEPLIKTGKSYDFL